MKMSRELLLFFGVHLREQDLGMALLRRREHGREGPARGAPWRPEIEHGKRMAIDRRNEVVLGQLKNALRVGGHAMPSVWI